MVPLPAPPGLTYIIWSFWAVLALQVNADKAADINNRDQATGIFQINVLSRHRRTLLKCLILWDHP